MVFRLVTILLVQLTLVPGATAAPRTLGPVEARLLRVIDGDTLVVDALVWPGHVVRVSVRLRGIDAPELRSRCPEERRHAEAARKALGDLAGSGPIWLTDIAGGKYFGRVVANAANARGEDLSTLMLQRRLARTYDGGRRQRAC